MADLTYETFLALLHERFTLGPAGPGHDPLEVRLVAVTASGWQRPLGGAAFSLLFAGPPAPILPQRIYPLSSESLGTVEMFLVPLTPEPDGARYEAVFN